MKIDESLFNKAEFIKWLESKSDNEMIGIACSAQFCPLAEFIREEKKLYPVIDVPSVTVTDGSVAMLPKTYRFNLPGWAQDFICLIDSSAVRQVSKRAALEALK